MVNGLDGDGAVQNYFNSSMSQEMVYTTSGASADVSGGGVRLNMIPRDGGNTFNGSVFAGYQNKSFQTDNLTDELKARGLRSADGIDKLSNFEASLGGPIKKDKVWFFMSARTFHLDTLPADVFHASGPATRPRRRRAAPSRASIRRTSTARRRASPGRSARRTSSSVYNDRLGKNRGAAMTAGFDPATASHRLEFADLHDRVGEDHVDADQQDPVRRRLLDQLRALQHPVSARHRESSAARPEWYTTDQQAGHRARHDVERRRRRSSGSIRIALAGRRSVSYVTGAHNIKVGIQDTLGQLPPHPHRQRRPPRVLPERRAFQARDPEHAGATSTDKLHADIGDLRAGLVDDEPADAELRRALGVLRLTASPRRRRRPAASPAARTFGPIEMPTWKSISPRFGAVYDLFGNQKTALKFSIGKYMQAGHDRVLRNLQPAGADDGERGLDRPERRRRAAGRARLHLS